MRDAFERIEKLAGNRLPESLETFFKNCEERIQLPAEFDVPNSSRWIHDLEHLFSLEEALDLLECDHSRDQFQTRLVPPNMVPIGSDAEGELIVVSLRESDFGVVLFPFHECCSLDDESLEGAIRLAASATAWIDSLRPVTEKNSTPDWEAIRRKKLEAIRKPKRPWWKFWAKSNS